MCIRDSMKRVCWRFRGWCLVCGSSEHTIANCGMKTRSRDRRENSARAHGVDERKCFVCEESGNLWESCPMRAEVEELKKKRKPGVSGNENAPPSSGVGRSQPE